MHQLGPPSCRRREAVEFCPFRAIIALRGASDACGTFLRPRTKLVFAVLMKREACHWPRRAAVGGSAATGSGRKHAPLPFGDQFTDHGLTPGRTCPQATTTSDDDAVRECLLQRDCNPCCGLASVQDAFRNSAGRTSARSQYRLIRPRTRVIRFLPEARVRCLGPQAYQRIPRFGAHVERSVRAWKSVYFSYLHD